MFKNYGNCTRCIHASVCQYKSTLKEIYDKINGHWDNLAAPDIFKLELECDKYKLDEATVKQHPLPWD